VLWQLTSWLWLLAAVGSGAALMMILVVGRLGFIEPARLVVSVGVVISAILALRFSFRKLIKFAPAHLK
jgi:hypothetical protein